jgi:hypothetical protein
MKPLDITFTTKIPNLLKKNVKEGIKGVLQLIRTRGFNVISMTTDGEFACSKEWTHSKGVIHEIVGAGSHVPEVENKIRTLKNRIRSKLASLNFILLINSLLDQQYNKHQHDDYKELCR